MNDVHEPSDLPCRSFSRRGLAIGSAFAVPVITGVGLAPAVAASTQIKEMNAVVNTQHPGVGNRNAVGSIFLDYAAIKYDPNLWQLTDSNNSPATATVIWKIEVEDAQGNVVATLGTRTPVLARWGQDSMSGLSVTGLAAGVYTVVSRITSVVYSPETVGDFTFKTQASFSSSSITVI